MLNRLPRQLPPLSMMLDDIGNPTNKEIARAICMKEATVRKWRKHDQAPHAVMLALFWLTKWGVAAVDAEAHNAAVMSAGIARERLTRIGELEGRIQRLGRIAQFGSANDPGPGVFPLPTMLASGSTAVKHLEQPSEKPGSSDGTTTRSTQQPCDLQQG